VAKRLAPVRVASERVIREVAGLRPFRPPGFRVAVEPLGEKTVVHNYGHGGGGISLSWGSADLAAELAVATPHRRAAVIGAGVIGLSTARLLQDRGFAVTVYAKSLPPDTTSNVAGAQWSPVSVVDSDRVTPSFETEFVAAARFAYRRFQLLAGARYGVWWRENYFLSEGPRRAGPPRWEVAAVRALVPRVPLAPGDHPFGSLTVASMLTMHIEPSIYLAALLADVRLAGAPVAVRSFPDRASLTTLDEPLLVNCTGLGSAALFDDRELVPIKGQLVVLAPQPEVDYITVGPDDLYMMPRQDGIILGGTHERGVWTLEPNPSESERILRGHRDLFSRMSPTGATPVR
jgi:glycine/D-amino acid oxidase-like deaminating enzyme